MNDMGYWATGRALHDLALDTTFCSAQARWFGGFAAANATFAATAHVTAGTHFLRETSW